jgi:SAM-dependent methyltransferase
LAVYDTHASAWLLSMRSAQVPRCTYLQRWLTDAVAGLALDARILEIGTASGRDADWLEKRGYTVQRSEAAAGLRDYLTRGGHDVLELNVLTDSLPDSDLDLILANAVLHHLTRDQARQALLSMRRAARRIAVSVRSGDGEGWHQSNGLPPRFFCYWTPESLTGVLRQSGFSRILTEVKPGAGRDAWLYAVASRSI